MGQNEIQVCGVRRNQIDNLSYLIPLTLRIMVPSEVSAAQQQKQNPKSLKQLHNSELHLKWQSYPTFI